MRIDAYNQIAQLYKLSLIHIYILPYSITFDDSYRNKVLVTSQANREKGNRTPYEYFGQDEVHWSAYEARVNHFIKDYKKRRNLLKQGFTKEDRREFKERNFCLLYTSRCV